LAKLAFFRELKYKSHSLFLSDDGAAGLRRLTAAIFEMPSIVT